MEISQYNNEFMLDYWVDFSGLNGHTA